MATVSKNERLLILAGLMSVLLASQATSMLIFGDGTSGGKHGQTQQQQQQQQQNGNFSDIQEQMNNNDNFTSMQGLVDIGFDNSTALTPKVVGKQLRLRIRELFTLHKQAMEEIRLRACLFNEEIQQDREELISEFRKVKAELRERIRISLQEARMLKQKLNNGTISQEEYNAEFQKVRLELMSHFNLMLRLGDEVGKLGKELANRNRELAQQLFQERHEFREELDQILREALEDWRGRGPP